MLPSPYSAIERMKRGNNGSSAPKNNVWNPGENIHMHYFNQGMFLNILIYADVILVFKSTAATIHSGSLLLLSLPKYHNVCDKGQSNMQAKEH